VSHAVPLTRVIGSSNTSYGVAAEGWTALASNDGWSLNGGTLPSIIDDEVLDTYVSIVADASHIIEFNHAGTNIPDTAVVSSEKYVLIMRTVGPNSVVGSATRNGVIENAFPFIGDVWNEQESIVSDILKGFDFNTATFGFASATDVFTPLDQCAEFALVVDFSLKPPYVSTQDATQGTESAVLRGTLEPNGATSAYPVTYYFEWMVTDSTNRLSTDRASTTTSATATGTAPVFPTATLSLPAVTYPVGTEISYRLVGTNAHEHAFYGVTLSFVVGGSNAKVIDL